VKAEPGALETGPGAGLFVEVAWLVRSGAVSAVGELKRVAVHVARSEGFSQGSLSIAVVGARRMSALHRETMRIDSPTDVLTFDLGTDRPRRSMDGEIVVCADVARRRAGRRARPSEVAAELALYVTHGLLHLCGYDDHTPGDFARMHRREDELLTQLGLGPVFGGAERSSPGPRRRRRR
jgi:probable rRNA maturation factor